MQINFLNRRRTMRFALNIFAGILFSASIGHAAEPAEGTLAHHLTTNAAARVTEPMDRSPFRAPNSLGMDRLWGATWSQSFWLRGVNGLPATPIGYTNVAGGQGLVTMVSPQHYLVSMHMHPESYCMAFLDTNNVIHWRRTLQRVDVGSDTSVGLLDKELPPAVGFLPVLPVNYTNYLPASPTNFVQGLGMNQEFWIFSQPMRFVSDMVFWNPENSVSNGPPKEWNMVVRGGDSSNPAMILIGNQLVLVSHNWTARAGPNYAAMIPAINQKMHLLSTNHHLAIDYQLTEFCLTNWPKLR